MITLKAFITLISHTQWYLKLSIQNITLFIPFFYFFFHFVHFYSYSHHRNKVLYLKVRMYLLVYFFACSKIIMYQKLQKWNNNKKVACLKHSHTLIFTLHDSKKYDFVELTLIFFILYSLPFSYVIINININVSMDGNTYI